MFVDAGAHYVVLDFDNAPDCDGDLTVMATQVRSALAWVYREADLSRDQWFLHGLFA